MNQLQSLDLWATDLSESDLEVVRDLPNLEYLSIGGYRDTGSLDSEIVVSLLLAMPSLESAWLDGIGVSAAQIARLDERNLKVRAMRHDARPFAQAERQRRAFRTAMPPCLSWPHGSAVTPSSPA